MRLSHQLLLVVLLALAVPGGLLVVKEGELRDSREEVLREAALGRVQVAEADLEQILRSTREQFDMLAQLEARSWYDGSCDASLAHLQTQQQRYAYLAVADPQGSIFCASDPEFLRIGVADQQDFLEAVQEGRFVVGRYEADLPGVDAAVQFAAPVRSKEGRIEAVILAGIRMEWLPGHLQTSDFPSGSSVLVADRDGTIIAAVPENDRLLGRPLGQPYALLLRAQNDGLWEESGQTADGARIIAYSPPSTLPKGLFIAVTIARAPYFATVERGTMADTVIIGLIVIATAATVWGIVTYRVVNPVRRLVRAAAKWRDGDYAARVGVNLHVLELGELGQVFDDLAERLALRERKLRGAAAAKAALLAVAGHDLRQPLQILTLVLDRLGDKAHDVKDARDLARAERSLDQLNEACDKLIEIARLDAGEMIVHRRRILLADLMGGIGAEWHSLAEAKGLKLKIVPSRAIVMSDPELVRTILRNLVGNAIKYTDRGTVLIGARRCGAQMRLQVVDTGKGIATDKIPLIFGEFQQIDPAREGFGLGLSIVRRMADTLGHRLIVASEPGKGSCFALELPLAPAD
jgi:signal transduction histidine kinase